MPARAKPKARLASSEDESDSAMSVLEAQRRIQELRKQKEERLRSVVADSHTALGELRSRVQRHYEQQRQQSINAQAKNVAILVESVERRKQIEAQMMELVVGMHARMKEVEAMILVGYEGRLDETRLVLDEARQALH